MRGALSDQRQSAAAARQQPSVCASHHTAVRCIGDWEKVSALPYLLGGVSSVRVFFCGRCQCCFAEVFRLLSAQPCTHGPQQRPATSLADVLAAREGVGRHRRQHLDLVMHVQPSVLKGDSFFVPGLRACAVVLLPSWCMYQRCCAAVAACVCKHLLLCPRHLCIPCPMRPSRVRPCRQQQQQPACERLVFIRDADESLWCCPGFVVLCCTPPTACAEECERQSRVLRVRQEPVWRQIKSGAVQRAVYDGHSVVFELPPCSASAEGGPCGAQRSGFWELCC